LSLRRVRVPVDAPLAPCEDPSSISTTEPCPRCFDAVHWARIQAIVYGTNIADARRTDFHELEISNRRLKALGRSPIEIIGDFLRP
jgi:tRNA(Arg) A34 adenosine deaminase TadA